MRFCPASTPSINILDAVPGYTLDDGLTLRNKLGATSYAVLERAETDYVAARLLQLELVGVIAGQFDAAHLKTIHRHLFQDVYEWAGRTRDEAVALSDGTVATEPLLRKADGNPFMAGPLIPTALQCMADRLRQANYLRGLSRTEFAVRAADVMVEINGIHAFRDGNGRTQRVFIRALAKEAGHALDFSVVTRERMVRASVAGTDDNDPTMMRRLFQEISDPVRVAALDKAIKALDRFQFPWNEATLATAEPGHRVVVTMAGVAGDQFMARTKTDILIGREADLPTPYPARGDVFTLAPSCWTTGDG
jgi:cell filamentation protein